MVLRSAIVFATFLLTAGVIARAQHHEVVPPRQPLDAFPTLMGQWQGRNDTPLTEKELQVLGADDYLLRSYFEPSRAASLYIGYWASQKRGDAVHSPLNCLPGSGWQPMSKRPLRLDVQDGGGRRREIQVNRYVIQKGLDRQMVLYWYQSHGRVIDSEYWGKFYLVADSVRMGRSDTAIVRVVAPIRGSDPAAETEAERNATQFVQQLFPLLDDFIPA
jgi:EpsI family protein